MESPQAKGMPTRSRGHNRSRGHTRSRGQTRRRGTTRRRGHTRKGEERCLKRQVSSGRGGGRWHRVNASFLGLSAVDNKKALALELSGIKNTDTDKLTDDITDYFARVFSPPEV